LSITRAVTQTFGVIVRRSLSFNKYNGKNSRLGFVTMQMADTPAFALLLILTCTCSWPTRALEIPPGCLAHISNPVRSILTDTGRDRVDIGPQNPVVGRPRDPTDHRDPQRKSRAIKEGHTGRRGCSKDLSQPQTLMRSRIVQHQAPEGPHGQLRLVRPESLLHLASNFLFLPISEDTVGTGRAPLSRI
jgi:hypothetical protein